MLKADDAILLAPIIVYRTEGPREPAAVRGGAWAFHCPRLGDFSNTYIEKSLDRYASEWACFI